MVSVKLFPAGMKWKHFNIRNHLKRLRLIDFDVTSSGSADEAEVVEFGHMIFHDGRPVAELGAPVLVVAGPDCDERSVVDAAQADDAKGRRKRLVGAPMCRK
jgi:hypothetical protein